MLKKDQIRIKLIKSIKVSPISLFLIGAFFCVFEISYTENWITNGFATGWLGDIFIHLGRVFGEFLIIASTVAFLFGQIEASEFMNEILDHRDMLVDVNSAGIDRMALNPYRETYKNEILKDETFIVGLRGALSFVTRREIDILDRLSSGKELIIYCDNPSVAKFQEWKQNQEQKGADLSKLHIKEHQHTLMYNFILCDKGVWIKTYFSTFYNHQIAAPAFFVRKDSPLWEIYQKDLKEIMGIC